mgnify:CR=1 FL=1
MDINLELGRIMMKALERNDKPYDHHVSCGRCGGSGEVVTVRHRDETVSAILHLLKTTNNNESVGLVVRNALSGYCAKLAEKNA